MLKTTKTWQATWNGQQIEVRSWLNILAQTGEELFINGQLVHQKRGWSITPSHLFGEIPVESTFAGEFYQKIHAKVGNVDFGFGVGCHIFIDGELVGGDVHKTILFSDDTTSRRTDSHSNSVITH
jgi:hypothetical protein